MKKWIVVACMLMLAACSSSETDEQTNVQAVDSQSGQNVETDASDVSLTEAEALTIAEQKLEALMDAIYNATVSYENGEESKEQPDISMHATANYIANYYTPEQFQCDGNDCDYLKLPQIMHYGYNPKIEALQDDRFTLTTLFNGVYVHEDIESYAQSVNFVLDGDTWKIDQFSNNKQDMNLQLSDVERYLQTQAFTDVRDITETTFELNGVEETAASFTDDYANQTLYVILRTGHIDADSNEFQRYYSHYEASEFAFLFDDTSYLESAIDRTNPEIDRILTVMSDTNDERLQLYDVVDYDLSLAMLETYKVLLSDTINAYAPLSESVDEYELFYSDLHSWEYMIEEFYTSQGLDHFFFVEMEPERLNEFTYLIRNQIYSMMHDETIRQQ